MENNFKKSIKKHFHNREIQPNPALWSVLESKLEVHQTKKKNKLLRFLAYASIFIGLLFAIALFFKGSKKNTKEDYITKQPVKTKIEVPNTKKKVVNKTIIPKNVIAKQEKKKVNRRKPIVTKTKRSVRPVLMAENVPLTEKNSKLPTINSDKEKIQHNIAKNTIVKKKKVSISDTDLDALLASSLTKLNEKDTVNSQISIKSKPILYAIENETNTPLKHKIIKTLMAGAQAVENHISNN